MSKYFDIETKPLSREEIEKNMPEFSAPATWKDEEKIAAKIEEQKVKFIEKAALRPDSAIVMAAGIFDDEEDEYYGLIVGDDLTEKQLLERFWEIMAYECAFTVNCIGWNILNFDVPFLIKRSWLLKVKMPRSVLEMYKGRVYFNSRFIDQMRVWNFGDHTKYAKLNAALQFFGLNEKVDLGEELFYQTFERDPVKAIQYLRRDVEAMVDLADYLTI